MGTIPCINTHIEDKKKNYAGWSPYQRALHLIFNSYTSIQQQNN